MEDAAEGIEVRARIDRIHKHLLGSHVAGSPYGDAGGGKALLLRMFCSHHLRDAEVDHLGEDVAARRRDQEDVLGLQIAVHDALLAGLDESTGHVLQDSRRVKGLEAPVGMVFQPAL